MVLIVDFLPTLKPTPGEKKKAKSHYHLRYYTSVQNMIWWLRSVDMTLCKFVTWPVNESDINYYDICCTTVSLSLEKYINIFYETGD